MADGMENPVVPAFFLYGEPPRDVGEHFLHVENLEARSRPSNWRIRPHCHGELNHLMLFRRGGGEVRIEDKVWTIVAPVLLVVPAGCIHEFTWRDDSAGWVLTVSSAYLDVMGREKDQLGDVFSAPRPVELDAASAAFLETLYVRLDRELSWRAPHHDAMVEALLQAVLVETGRRIGSDAGGASDASSADARLVARFRDLLEQEFRTRHPVGFYARKLGVSESRLRTACRNATGRSPVTLATDRVMLEARRRLHYTSMTVSEIAIALGYDDPAYFTRLFAAKTSEAPSAYRRRRMNQRLVSSHPPED